MSKKELRFGIIGCGLLGREIASAVARWCHLLDLDFVPRIVAACDVNPVMSKWFEDNVPTVRLVTSNYHELLDDPDIDAIYCAVPHNLHASLYTDIIAAGKHLLGEKPFGIDLEANRQISQAVRAHPAVLVRCSSEFPFFPGALRINQMLREERFGRIIEVEAGFWHSSDLDPRKPINWKRRIATCGEYGCLGDLGMHVVHLPFRCGIRANDVRALLSKIVPERPDQNGQMAPCETWDNAILACQGQLNEQEFPLVLSTKRIAPGHQNTWFLRVIGTELSAEFSTKNPKELRTLPYAPGDEQAWRHADVPYHSAYPVITGSIFEFGFSDALLQMWAAFCDEMVNGPNMKGRFGCATPTEAALGHQLFTAALESQRIGNTVEVESVEVETAGVQSA
jgi:predicted dehydrogenase